jgi:hypothetical protein
MGIGRLKLGRGFRLVGDVSGLAIFGLVIGTLFLSSCESPLRDKIQTLTEAYSSINDERAIYVDIASGDDSNPGTQELPKKTIQAGIDFVISFLGRGKVKVKNGTYLQTDKLVIKEGASIEGGYGRNWVRQDLVNEDTQTIVRGRDAADGSDSIVTAQTDPGVRPSTVISGISFETGIGYQSMTLVVKNASPFFKYCIVSGSGGVGETIAVAVMTQSGYAQRSEPVFRGCMIEGGAAIGNTYAVQATGDTTATFQYCAIAPGFSQTGYSYGIYFVGCEVHVESGGVVGVFASAATSAIGVYGKNGILKLEDCHVAGGYAAASTKGVESDNCSGYIRNSTVYGGKGTTTSTGVFLAGASMPYVRNCTINGGGVSTSVTYGVFGYSSGAIIENCLIWCDNPATWSCAVTMYGISSVPLPSALNNCDLFNTMYCYAYFPNDSAQWTFYNADAGGVGGMEGYLAGREKSSSFNISVSGVGFVYPAVDIIGSNWALTSSTPPLIKSGGKNFSSLFTDDKAGSTRPATGGWSIGAYQYP